jgi:TolB-like protein/Flp pilus assembly protein TadD
MALLSAHVSTFDPAETFRFGDFELDVAGYELRRHGQPVRLERQPMDLLILLVERRRRLVSRTEIVERLWSKDVFVDVDTGVNTAIRKIRQALDDSRAAPTFVETVAGKGYRFTGAVEVVTRSTGTPSAIRLAVLPFETLGESERDYLADGLTEDAIASLGRIDPEHLRVIGRTSMMAYKGTTKSLTAIGDELGVDYLVEGSIRSESGRLRITAKLNRVRDQVQVWSASYDREPTSLLEVQQELSAAIARQIMLRLSPAPVAALSRRHTGNPDAYDQYLRGRRFWNQFTPATTLLAVECFTRATQLDPEYALAWAGIGEAYVSSPINGDAPAREAFARAGEAAAHAVRTGSDLAEAQHVLGQVNFFSEWDWPAAEAAYRRAVVLDPSFAWAHSMLGHLLSQSGRHDEARLVMRRACELDPLSSLHHAMSSQVAFQSGDQSSALSHAQRAIVIDPHFWVGYMMRGQAYEQLGETDLALEALITAARLSGGNSKPISVRGYLLASRERAHEALEVLAMIESVSRHRYVPPYAMALIHAGLNEQEAVFAWLDRACAARDVHLIFLTVDPKWNRYRSEPRFLAVLDRCNFARRADGDRSFEGAPREEG